VPGWLAWCEQEPSPAQMHSLTRSPPASCTQRTLQSTHGCCGRLFGASMGWLSGCNTGQNPALLLSCSSRSPSTVSQLQASPFLLSPSLISRQQAKTSLAVPPRSTRLVFSVSMMQQVVSLGHRSLFLFCGRRFNYSASEPHPSFPVQSPPRASRCVFGT